MSGSQTNPGRWTTTKASLEETRTHPISAVIIIFGRIDRDKETVNDDTVSRDRPVCDITISILYNNN